MIPTGLVIVIATATFLGCNAVTGVSELRLVECGDGCAGADGPEEPGAADLTWRPSHPCVVGEEGCIGLPDGWAFGVLAPSSRPACPAGFDGGRVVGEGPSGDALCHCDACTVTADATCTGVISVMHGSTACTASESLRNDPPGTCENTRIDFDTYNELVPPLASGGACIAAAPVFDASKSGWQTTYRACHGLPRCKDGICDARGLDPLSVCIAKVGDGTCPPEFPMRHLVGGAVVGDCAGTCSCVVGGRCRATLAVYDHSSCEGEVTTIPADGTCGTGTTFADEHFWSYKTSLTTTTTCSATGTRPAENVRVSEPETFCCR